MGPACFRIEREPAVRFVFGAVVSQAGCVWQVRQVNMPLRLVCGVGR